MRCIPVDLGCGADGVTGRRAQRAWPWHRRASRGVGWVVLAGMLLMRGVPVGAAPAVVDFVTSHGGASRGLFSRPFAVAVSPDGGHVYVASYDDDAVGVFSRDGATGALTFVEGNFDGAAGVDGLDGASSVAVSPDGGHVYAAARYDDAVAVFSRDGATGALTFVEAQVDGVGGVDGLRGAVSVTVSPDGGHVYAGSILDDAVVVFSRDGATGALTFVEAEFDGVAGVDTLDNAVSVTVSPDGGHVYVASESDSAVTVFSRDGATGALTFVEAQVDGVGGVDGLYGPESVTVSPDGEHVYVATHIDDAVAVFSRDGATGELTFVEAEFDGVGGATGLDWAFSVTVSPDGGHVYVASWDDAVAVFGRDGGTGALAFVEAEFGGDTGGGVGGAQSATVSPDGGHVYVAGDIVGSVAVFTRDAGTGALTLEGYEFDGVGGVDGLAGARSITLSPDGAHAYVAASDDDAVAVFGREGGTGALTFVEAEFDGVGGVAGLDGARAVAVSPDGVHVYVASYDADAVAVFDRDGGTGALTFVEAEFDGVGGVDGLDGAGAVAVSPDGAHVYVASYDADAVAVFDRDGGTGALTFVEAEFDGVGNVTGLNGAQWVTVSPDGGQVYVASANDNALALFSRDGATGALTFVEVTVDGEGGVNGLSRASSVAVSSDGAHAYVTGPGDEAVAVFGREGSTGTLAFVEVEFDKTPGVDGLEDARAVAVSPDGGHVYVASGRPDNAVAVFATGFSGCGPIPVMNCRTAVRGVLSLADRSPDKRDAFAWTWIKGETTSAAEFDPATSNHYAMCVYDESGVVPQLVLRALAPANGDCGTSRRSRPCWNAVTRDQRTQFRYADRWTTPEGLIRMILSSSSPRQNPFIRVKGRGEDVGMPALPLPLPLRVQLQRAGGGCWEATYSAPRVNTTTRFRATSD